MINTEKLTAVAEKGLARIMAVLETDNPTKEQVVQARLATSVLATTVRHEAAQNARLGLQVRIATLVLKDSKERRKYLAASNPELKMLG